MSTPPPDQALRFTPSRVTGLPDVAEVAVFPDRLELLSAGKWAPIRFYDIARWHRNDWLWRRLARLGWMHGRPYVADRDWFHPPSERFFAFFTEPKIVIYMPDEPTGVDWTKTIFRRVDDMIRSGGFNTYDLG